MFLSYTRLKNDFVEMCSNYINDTNFFQLKNFYEKDLNSIRRLSYCYNLGDLIKLLEKADILKENDVTTLRQMVMNIGEENLSSVLSYIELYENQQSRELPRNAPFQTNTNNYNQPNPIHNQPSAIPYIPQRIPVTPSAPQYIPPQQNVPNIRQHIPYAPLNTLPVLRPNVQPNDGGDVVRNICFQIISQKLGNKWKDVGRVLGLREGDMDLVTRTFKKDTTAQILEMLHRFEEEPLYERRTLRTSLTTALRKAKREDLVIEISRVFDRYTYS